MKRTIRLTEGQLHGIVENAIKGLLKELDYGTMKSASDKAIDKGRERQGINIKKLAKQNALDRDDILIPNLGDDSLYVNPNVKADNVTKNTSFRYRPEEKVFQNWQMQPDNHAKLSSSDNNPRFTSSKDARKLSKNMDDLGLGGGKNDWHDFKY